MSALAERGERDRGVATIWAAGAIAALLLVATLLLTLAAAVATRHRGTAAADLAALAAAAHAPSGQPVACGRAGWVARQMRVSLVHCELRGWTAQVRVSSTPPGLLRPFGAAQAHARAGPTGQ